jgi:hypothetical protein
MKILGRTKKRQVVESKRPREVHRADFVLSWAFLTCLILLFLNDFVLKREYPGFLSGILSDFAGIVFFPLLAVAVAETVARLVPGKPLATPGWFVLATATVATLFVVVKFTTLGENIYWSIVSPIASIAGPFGTGTSGVVSDPWDLLAFLFIPIPIMVGKKYRTTKGVVHPNG